MIITINCDDLQDAIAKLEEMERESDEIDFIVNTDVNEIIYTDWGSVELN